MMSQQTLTKARTHGQVFSLPGELVDLFRTAVNVVSRITGFDPGLAVTMLRATSADRYLQFVGPRELASCLRRLGPWSMSRDQAPSPLESIAVWSKHYLRDLNGQREVILINTLQGWLVVDGPIIYDQFFEGHLDQYKHRRTKIRSLFVITQSEVDQ